MKVVSSLLFIFSFLFSAAACAEPSENELYKAYDAFNKNELGGAFRMVRIKKLSCTKIRSNEFVCIVDVTSEYGTERKRQRFINTKNGWELL